LDLLTKRSRAISPIEPQTVSEAHGLPEGDDCHKIEDDKTGQQNTQTLLERICALPEHIADRELTANQERERFIATDVWDYTEKAPAGLVIDSRAIKRVITAKEGTCPHTQIVARVMNFLDDLGKVDIDLKKCRGKKLVVVDPKAADCYHSCCDRGANQLPPMT
jgi:hypothetical protein